MPMRLRDVALLAVIAIVGGALTVAVVELVRPSRDGFYLIFTVDIAVSVWLSSLVWDRADGRVRGRRSTR